MKNTSRIEHPQFECYLTRGKGEVIVSFRTGHYDHPSEEVELAWERIVKAVDALNADINLCRKRGANVVMHPPMAKIINPPVTDQQKQEMIAAALAANPGWHSPEQWESDSNGLHGFSVLLVADKET